MLSQKPFAPTGVSMSMNQVKNVDILAIGAHPDDIELSCGGTLLKHIAEGKSVALVDLTHGELGTRGSGELRLQEAEKSRLVLGVQMRENLNLGDGFFSVDQESLLNVVYAIRKYRPRIVLANAVSDRHPDHGRGAELVSRACFLSGLRRIETRCKNNFLQEAWRPTAVYHYIQDHQLRPDLVVDVTPFMDKKMEAIRCFGSQFFDPGSDEPNSPISGKDFFDYIKAKSRIFGRFIGVEFGEGFNVERPIGVDDLTELH